MAVSQDFIMGMQHAHAIMESVLSDPDWEGQIGLGMAATLDQMVSERIWHYQHELNSRSDSPEV